MRERRLRQNADEFFLSLRQGIGRKKEITYEDKGSDADREIWLMDESVLSDFIDDEGQKLLYVFDYMTDRAFFIEMTDIVTGRSLKDPFCSLSLVGSVGICRSRRIRLQGGGQAGCGSCRYRSR